MKHSLSSIIFLFCIGLLPLCAETSTRVYTYKAFSPVWIHTDDVALETDSGSLKHDLSINLNYIPYQGGYELP